MSVSQGSSTTLAIKCLKKTEIIRLQQVKAPGDIHSPHRREAMCVTGKCVTGVTGAWQVEHILSEKAILACLAHPFIVRMVAAFQGA